MIFGTFSIWGCGGQGCYFQPNQRVISQMPPTQDSQTTFKPNLTWIFLSLRARYIMSKPVGRPCTSSRFSKDQIPHVIEKCWQKSILYWLQVYCYYTNYPIYLGTEHHIKIPFNWAWKHPIYVSSSISYKMKIDRRRYISGGKKVWVRKVLVQTNFK